MIIEAIILGTWIATGLCWNGRTTTNSFCWLMTLASTSVSIAAYMGAQ